MPACDRSQRRQHRWRHFHCCGRSPFRQRAARCGTAGRIGPGAPPPGLPVEAERSDGEKNPSIRIDLLRVGRVRRADCLEQWLRPAIEADSVPLAMRREPPLPTKRFVSLTYDETDPSTPSLDHRRHVEERQHGGRRLLPQGIRCSLQTPPSPQETPQPLGFLRFSERVGLFVIDRSQQFCRPHRPRRAAQDPTVNMARIHKTNGCPTAGRNSQPFERASPENNAPALGARRRRCPRARR